MKKGLLGAMAGVLSLVIAVTAWVSVAPSLAQDFDFRLERRNSGATFGFVTYTGQSSISMIEMVVNDRGNELLCVLRHNNGENRPPPPTGSSAHFLRSDGSIPVERSPVLMNRGDTVSFANSRCGNTVLSVELVTDEGTVFFQPER